MKRRDFIHAGTGLFVAGLPSLAGAASHSNVVRFTPPFAPPPIPDPGPGHLMAATPDGVKHGIEVYMQDMDPFFYQMIENQNPIENGQYRLPEGPGFGFVYDKKVVAKYRHEA